MEKDNKYYGIIENLVRTHRKFEGCEPILDDIIDDVYKHAQTVIAALKDEDILLSYLQKLVSVSVITVPKRMNFHNEIKHRTISSSVVSDIIKEKPQEIIKEQAEPPVFAEPIENVVPEPVQNDVAETVITEPEPVEEPEVKANVEFVDRMINSIDTASIVDDNKPDESFDISEDDNLESLILEEPNSIEAEEISVAEKDDNQAQELDFADTAVDEEETELADYSLSEDNAEQVISEDEPFVSEAEPEDITVTEDNAADDITEETFLISNEDEPAEFSVSEGGLEEESDDNTIDLLAEPQEIETEIDTDTVTEIETEILPVEEDVLEDEPELLPEADGGLSMETEKLSLDTEDNFETVDEIVDSVDENIQMSEDNLTLEGDTDSLLMQEDDFASQADENFENVLSEDAASDDFSFDGGEDDLSIGLADIDTDSISLADPVSDIQEFDDTQDIQLSASFEDNGFNQDVDSSFELTEEESIEPISADSAQASQAGFKQVDYSLFDLPQKEADGDIDIKNIELALADLNKQKPELNILKVFELRYKQNLPIANIAEELQLDKQAVIAAIDEIVDLV